MRFSLVTLTLVGFLAIGFRASASGQADYRYNFPGCDGGGGGWPAAVYELEQNTCASGASEVEVEFGQHCNGYLTLGVQCQNLKIKSVEVKDCFCD